MYIEGEKRSVFMCVFARVSDLQLHCACGVLQQADGLRVAHAFSRCSTDADDAVTDLQK